MIEIRQGDARERLAEIPAGSVSLCVCSPPYFGLRSYLPAEHPDKAREIGGEESVEEHIAALVEVFGHVKKALHPEGLLAINYGDAYTSGDRVTRAPDAKNGARAMDWRPETPAGLKPKDLLGLPFRLAFALQQAGWWWRSLLPWLKKSALPDSTEDRPGTSVEYVLLFSRSARYFWDGESVRRPQTPEWIARTNARTVPRPPPRGGGTDGKAEHTSKVYAATANGRNFRNSDLFFDTLAAAERAAYEEWRYLKRLKERGGLMSDEEGDPLALLVNPQAMKEAHYAAYPEALIAPLIRAGSSEEGVCGACAAPWRRVTERIDTGERQKMGDNWDTGAGGHGNFHRSGREKGQAGVTVTVSVTTGWQPSCTCNAEKIPALILDPFAGAGTTCKVAQKLGRRAIGIELSEEYVGISERRLAQGALGL